MKAKKLALLGLLCAIALTVFLVEAQIPPLIPVPGVKLGLSNIVTVFTVFCIGPAEGVLLLAARIFLGSVFAGNFSSILYSAAGGACAIALTIAAKRILKEKQLWIAGCLGAVAHCVGQMIAAIVITGTPAIAVYLPFMIVCGLVTGTFTGLAAQLLVNRGRKIWKTFLK